MADAVSTQKLMDGPRNVIMKFTNISDGTGEAAVTKVDVSGLDGAPDEVSIQKIIFSTIGMGVNILFDATADILAKALPPDDSGELCFKKEGGIWNNAGTGKTGDISFTTVGAAAGDEYSVTLVMKKKYS